MKVLHKGKCILEGLANITSKTKTITLWDGKIVIANLHVLPGVVFSLGMSCSNALKISGKGSRGAYFDGLYVRWPEDGHND